MKLIHSGVILLDHLCISDTALKMNEFIVCHIVTARVRPSVAVLSESDVQSLSDEPDASSTQQDGEAVKESGGISQVTFNELGMRLHLAKMCFSVV